MKNFIIFCLALISCNFETPTQFSELALNDEFVSLEGKEVAFKSILESHKDKTILIDVWASWCKDCIGSWPVLRALQQEFPEVIFMFLSLDGNRATWKRGIKKYDIQGEHYFIKSGSDGPFRDFLNSNWIPRYMVVDKQGNIKLFKATKITDKRIKENLNLIKIPSLWKG